MRRRHKHCNTVPGYIRKGAPMHCNREYALLCVWSNLQEGIIEPIHQYSPHITGEYKIDTYRFHTDVPYYKKDDYTNDIPTIATIIYVFCIMFGVHLVSVYSVITRQLRKLEMTVRQWPENHITGIPYEQYGLHGIHFEFTGICALLNKSSHNSRR